MPEHRKSKLYVVNVTANGQQLAPANSNRVAIYFLASPAAFYAVKDDTQTGSNDGIIINTNMAGVYFDVEHHGDIVQKAWYVWSQSTPSNCCYVEVIGP